MALNEKDKRTVEMCRGTADQIYSTVDNIDLVISRWYGGGENMLTADITELYPDITKADVTNFITACETVRNALKPNGVDGQILNVIKMMR